MLTICSTPKKHPATSVPLGANADPRSRSICWHSLKCSIARSIITMSLSIYLGRVGKDPMLPTTKTIRMPCCDTMFWTCCVHHSSFFVKYLKHTKAKNNEKHIEPQCKCGMILHAPMTMVDARCSHARSTITAFFTFTISLGTKRG